MKYWQKENDPKTAILKFYGHVGHWWNGALDFTATIEELEKKFDKVEIRLHCYGGDVFEGNAIFNAIQRTSLEVEWVIDGVAASMASIIMLAKGKIKMAANAFVMIHVPKGYTSGDASAHFNTAKLLQTMQQNFGKAYARRTGKSVKEVEQYLDGGDHWFGADECVEMKIADEIIGAVEVSEDVNVKPDDGADVVTIFNRFAASAEVGTKPETKIQNKSMDKQQIITAFALGNVTAASSDTAVFEALKAKFTEQESRINTLTAESTKNVDAMISAKETELNTPFTEDQKKGFKEVAKAAGSATLQTVLDAMKPVANLKTIITPEGKTNPEDDKDERKNWTWADWSKNDPKGLEALNQKDDPKFKALYEAEFGNE